MRFLVSLCFLVLTSNSFSQDLTAYKIYNEKGKRVSPKKMMKAIKDADITFYGEYHNNPIAHWLEFEITQELAKENDNKIILGFEMFEADQQILLNDMLQNMIKERKFEDSCRLWSNYETDYKPIVQFAKNNNIPCIATNIPRRIASMVFKKGVESLDSLDTEELAFMCSKEYEVDTTLSQYQFMMGMSNDHATGMNFVYSQAIKDATMAHFIDRYWKENYKFIHFNGSFHTDFHQGIIWYLQRLRPNLNYVSIATVEQENCSKLEEENIGRASFIICVPVTMTKTH